MWRTFATEATLFIAIAIAVNDFIVALMLIAFAAIIRELHFIKMRQSPR